MSISKKHPVLWRIVPIFVSVLLIGLSVWVFIAYRNSFSVIIQSFGMFGVVVAILLMALLCIIPVPAEFLIIVLMGMYGVYWGIFYSWIGSMIGAVIAMYVTRWLGQARVRRLFTEQRQQQIDQWISRRGTLGLLALRFAPFVPYHVLNYVAGLMNIRLWPFLWTTALGLIPFYIGMGGVFLGLSHGIVTAGIAVVVVLAVLGFVSYLLRKRWLKAFLGHTSDEHDQK
nr:TVP38/TMEM64 family protein [Bacilli bacterium]